jgi:glycosyltransferase involved in cell wall biosynthesis
MPTILSSMHSDWHPRWSRCVDALDRRKLSRAGLLLKLVREARRHRVVVGFGMVGLADGYVDLLAAALIARRSRRVVIAECGWEPGSRALARLLRRKPPVGHDPLPAGGAGIVRALIRAFDTDRTHYCVLSEDDRQQFPRAWGIPAARVHVTPFCYTVSDLDVRVTRNGAIFAGGNSSRDYRPLLAAARDLDAPVTIATTLPLGDVPPNVKAGSIPHAEYERWTREAGVVVVPLLGDAARSAGQTTYLNAMALGKPVIVTDSPGVRTYIEDGATGVIVPPDDPAALREAIRWTLDSRNDGQVQRMCERARHVALERFSPTAYLDAILAVTEDAASASGAAEPSTR